MEWQGRAEILRFLLEGGHVPVPSIGGVAAYRAARFGDLDFIKWLASHYMGDVDVQYWTHALEHASEGGHLSAVEWILVHVDGIVRANGPSEAMFAAAECGKLEVVQWLYKKYGGKLSVDVFQERVVATKFSGVNDLLHDEDLEPTTAMDAAAKNGHLGVLQFLDGVDAASRNKQKKRGGKSMPHHQRGHYPRCTSFAMDAAAALGHLNVVKWLHSHRSEGCTTEAMDRAAGNGHLDVVQWLHSHRSEGCTTRAMDSAASRRFHVASCDGFRSSACCLDMRPRSFCDKQLAMLQWLLLNRTERCSSAAMDGAVGNGDFKLMQWLHDNATAWCNTTAMDSAIRLGRLDLVKWLQQNYPKVRTSNAMPEAATQGCFEVVKWLHEDASEEAEAKSIQRAAAQGHLRLVQWLVSRCTNVRAIFSAMQSAISSEHFEVIIFLDSKLADHCNDDDLKEMRYDQFAYGDIAHWFNEKYPPSSQ